MVEGLTVVELLYTMNMESYIYIYACGKGSLLHYVSEVVVATMCAAEDLQIETSVTDLLHLSSQTSSIRNSHRRG